MPKLKSQPQVWTRRKLEALFKKKKIVPKCDLDTNWLRVQRPTVAFLLCLCSGPWQFQRRYNLQCEVLKRVRDKDLTKFNFKFPLGWQNRYLEFAKDAVRKSADKKFDKFFNFNKSTKETEREEKFNTFMFLGFAGEGVEVAPKIVGMFARDYCCIDCFPQDRHVKRLLKELGLPSKEEQILEIFHKCNLSPREYARGFFSSKSSNPQHDPAVKDWMKIRK